MTENDIIRMAKEAGMEQDVEYMKNLLIGGDPSFAKHWNQICEDFSADNHLWINGLRAQGIKAAHPNDGWVDQSAQTMQFVYPQFNDGAGVSDLVMLGRHYEQSNQLIKLTRKRVSTFGSVSWEFDYVGQA
jgi:hypothetical protein